MRRRTSWSETQASSRITAAAGSDFLDGGAGANALSDGPGRDYCLERAGARSCEIVGVCGRLPAIAGPPPALREARTEPVSGRRSPVVMHLPGRYRAVLRSYRERLLRTFSGDAPPRGAGGNSGWPFEWPLLRLLESGTPPGTRAFRYWDQPSCFSNRKPYRTTVAPPIPIQPAMPDGGRETVFWRGFLFRRVRGITESRPVKVTPWVAAVVQATGVATGYPAWRSADQASRAPQRFSCADCPLGSTRGSARLSGCARAPCSRATSNETAHRPRRQDSARQGLQLWPGGWGNSPRRAWAPPRHTRLPRTAL